MKSHLGYRLFVILLIVSWCALANCQAGQWTYKAHTSTPRTSLAAATGQDGKIYVFGGSIEKSGIGDYLKSAEVYDPATDSWSAIADLPKTIVDIHATTLDDGRIMLTGYSIDFGIKANACYFYDAATDAYSNGAVIPLAITTRLITAVGNDGNVIAMVPALSQLWSYNIATTSWTQLADYPGPDYAALVSDANHLIYAVGGYKNGYSTDTWTYNDHTHAWTQIASMGYARWNLGATFAGDGRLYAIGGNTNGAGLSVVEAYDPSTGVWSSVNSLNTARGEFGCATDGFGRIFAIAGSRLVVGFDEEANQLDLVESYQPSLLVGAGNHFSHQEGTSFSGDVAAFTDKGPLETATNYVASIDWGDGAHTVGNVVAGQQPGSFVVQGTHTYALANSYVTKIQVNDTDGDACLFTGSASISNAPITGNAIDFSASASGPFSGIVAHYNDGNPSTKASDYLATAWWGDLTSSAATVTANNVSGFDVSGGHTYNTPGTYNFKIELFDGAQVVYFSGTATVAEPPPVVSSTMISAVEGSLFSGKVGSFTNADPNLTASSFTGSVDWGDGSTSPAFIASDGSGGFNVNGSHTYHHFGDYSVKATVSVTGGGSANATSSAHVTDAVLAATGYDLIVKTTNFSDTVATFVDANAFGLLGEYRAQILWGDGKSSVGSVTVAGSGYRVTGSHSYSKKGKYTVTITIGDGGTATASATTHINAGPVK